VPWQLQVAADDSIFFGNSGNQNKVGHGGYERVGENRRDKSGGDEDATSLASLSGRREVRVGLGG
jgi:hypothetical protein